MKILMQALHVPNKNFQRDCMFNNVVHLLTCFFSSQGIMILYCSMLEYIRSPQGDCILHEQFP
jgi:hypothetical protein